MPDFGQLRSLLQNQHTTPTELLDTLRLAHERDPLRYEDQWKPYLQGFPLPPFHAVTHEQLAQQCQLLPLSAKLTFLLSSFVHLDTLLEPQHQRPLKRIGKFVTQNQYYEEKHLQHICQHGAMPNLRELTINYGRLSRALMMILAAAQTLPNLRTLDLSNHRNRDMFAALFTGRIMNQIDHLSLNNTQMDHDVTSEFTRLLNTDQLKHLSLNDNPLLIRGCQRLANCRKLSNLLRLRLNNAQTQDKGLRALAESDYLKQLDTLDVANNAITIKGLERITHQTFPGLKHLDLSSNEIGFTKLAKESSLHTLQTLNLSSNKLNDRTIRALFDAQPFTDLVTLDLSNNNIGKQGAALLANTLPDTIKHLDLRQNQIGNAGAMALANTPRFSTLETFKISLHSIGIPGQLAIANSPHLPKHIKAHWDSIIPSHHKQNPPKTTPHSN